MRHSVASLVVIVAALTACTSTSSPEPLPASRLLSPAPVGSKVPLPVGGCYFGIIRASAVHGSDALDVLGDYRPSYLPDGFGLFLAFKPPASDPQAFNSSRGAIWSDAACHGITLEIWPGATADESPRPDDVWVKTLGDDRCTDGEHGYTRCIDFHAQANGDVLNVHTVGLTYAEARRVVNGIPF